MVIMQNVIDATPYDVATALMAFALLIVVLIARSKWQEWREHKAQQPAGVTSRALSNHMPSVEDSQGVQSPASLVMPFQRSEVDELASVEWLHIVTNEPDKAPHILIAGESGTGKTTVAQAMLTERAGLVVIADPKPTRPGAHKWGGLESVTIDTDGSYRSIEALFVAVLKEVDRRLAEMRTSHKPFEPLTIVADEWLTLLAKCPSAVKLYEIANIGRELSMRLIILSISDQVKSLKLDGRGDLRENFRFLRLGDKALTANPDTTQQERPACLEWRGKNVLIDVENLDKLAQLAAGRVKVWQGSKQLSESVLLKDMLVTQLPDRETELPAELPRVTAVQPEVTRELPVSETSVSPAEVAFITAKLVTGNSPSQVAKALPGYSPRNYKTFAAKVDFVKGLLDAQDLTSAVEEAEADQRPITQAA